MQGVDRPIPEHSHVMQCDANQCLICDDKLVEMQEAYGEIYRTLLFVKLQH
jgi:hypothetical protein